MNSPEWNFRPTAKIYPMCREKGQCYVNCPSVIVTQSHMHVLNISTRIRTRTRIWGHTDTHTHTSQLILINPPGISHRALALWTTEQHLQEGEWRSRQWKMCVRDWLKGTYPGREPSAQWCSWWQTIVATDILHTETECWGNQIQLACIKRPKFCNNLNVH